MYILLMFVKCFIYLSRQSCRKSCRNRRTSKNNKQDSGFALSRRRTSAYTWIDFKMASRFSMLRNLAFRRNLRLLCQQVRTSLAREYVSIIFLRVINVFVFRTDRSSREIVQFVRVCPSKMEILTRLVE